VSDPSFSLILATKGRPEVLRDTLLSAAQCDPPPAETIVVDGDEGRSAEPVTDELAAKGVPIRYAASRPGLTLQRNVGLDLAQGDVVVFVDDDTDLDPGLFAALADGYRDADVVGVTGRVLDRSSRKVGGMRSRWRRFLPGGGREGSLTRFGYPRRIQDEDREHDMEYMLGGLMTARREAAASVRFDEKLAGYGLAEDEDFSYRLSRVGRIRFLPQASVVHKNVGLGGKAAGARSFNRMVVVNRTYLFRKNFKRTPLARLQFAMLVGVLVVHRTLNGEWAGIRGLVDGSIEAWRQRR
jgi:glycosyltransferase involved in cell wall biosynthesis